MKTKMIQIYIIFINKKTTNSLFFYHIISHKIIIIIPYLNYRIKSERRTNKIIKRLKN